MKKSIKNVLMISILAIAGIFGASSIALNNKVDAEPVTEKAEAASVPSGVYVDISACQWNTWGASLSNIKAHFFKGSTSYTTWPGTSVSSATVNGTTYGYVAVPSGATQVIFNAWGGDRNQNKTEDLTIPTDGKILFKVTSFNTSSVQTGSWSNLDVMHPSSSLLSPSSTTARVFINNDSAHADWKSAVLGIRAWGGSSSTLNSKPVTASVYAVSWFDGNWSSVYYAYADIPNDCTAFQVVRLSGDSQSASVWSYSDSVTKGNTSFSCIYYLVGGSTDSMTLSPGGAKDDHAGSTLLQKVIESYDTCSSSNYNGYGDANELNTNFYSHADDWAKAQTGTSRGGSSVALSTHFDAMITRKAGGTYNGLANLGFTLFGAEEDMSTVIIIVASSVALLSVTALSILVIKKRKREQE